MSHVNDTTKHAGYAYYGSGLPTLAPPSSEAPKPPKRARAVAALGFSQAVDNSESGLTKTFFPLIAAAFGLGYTQLGIFSAIPMFARMIFGPTWAMAADRFGRKRVLVLVTGVWGLWTVASGFATSYTALVVLFAISAVGTVASEPVLNGMLPDLFKQSERGKAYGMVRGIGGGVGILIGPAIGLFGSNPEGWRYALWTMGAISIVSGLLILLWVPKPAVKSVSVTDDPESGTFRLRDVGQLFRIPTIWMIVVMLPFITSLILLSFYTQFLVDVRGMGVPEAALVMAVFSLGSMFSAFLGGFLGDLVTARFGYKGRIMLMQVYLVCFAATIFLATQIDSTNRVYIYAATFVMGLVFSIGFSGCVLPIVSTVVPKKLGASAFAFLFSFVQGGITAILSINIGIIADVFGDLQVTFLWFCVVPYLINAVVWCGFYFCYPRDAARQAERERREAEALAAKSAAGGEPGTSEQPLGV
ncbi:MFS transporter [Brachybacterium sp. NPDC056505]|uniref:MFS transporter n=1 Tax=Brachybacterium sp. NPDC056505 TaxID=3345843 RepID=UPI003670D947